MKTIKESAFDDIERKWTEDCQSVGDGYVQGQTFGKISQEQSLTSQVDFGWTLWKTRKAGAFSQKAKKYLLDVCRGVRWGWVWWGWVWWGYKMSNFERFFPRYSL